METMICILPTGDWAVINANSLPRFVSLNADKMQQLCDGEITVEDLDS